MKYVHCDAQRQGVDVPIDAHRGNRLLEERKRLGRSQQEIADAVGVRREMWARYESGTEPGADVLSNALAQGIDVIYVLSASRTAPVAPAVDRLSSTEAGLIEAYRRADDAGRHAILVTSNAVAGGSTRRSAAGSRSTVVVNGPVGKQVNGDQTIYGSLNIDMGGSRRKR